ncbi:hypothetical protein BGX33_001458 [Mortierella sp. NVP41]|nr:hypothetical protein BGX33_001458 [Mortierella sp. NVP41]
MWIDYATTFYTHFQNDIRDLNVAIDSFRATLRVLKREGYRWTEDYLENTLDEVYKNRVHDFIKDLYQDAQGSGYSSSSHRAASQGDKTLSGWD